MEASSELPKKQPSISVSLSADGVTTNATKIEYSTSDQFERSIKNSNFEETDIQIDLIDSLLKQTTSSSYVLEKKSLLDNQDDYKKTNDQIIKQTVSNWPLLTSSSSLLSSFEDGSNQLGANTNSVYSSLHTNISHTSVCDMSEQNLADPIKSLELMLKSTVESTHQIGKHIEKAHDQIDDLKNVCMDTNSSLSTYLRTFKQKNWACHF